MMHRSPRCLLPLAVIALALLAEGFGPEGTVLAADPVAAPDPWDAPLAPPPAATAPAAAGGPANAPLHRAMGLALADNLHLGELDWTPAEQEGFIDGIRASLRGEPAEVDDAMADFIERTNTRIAELQRRRQEEQKNVLFQDLRQSFGLEQTRSGLCYRIISAGGGARPRTTDTVIVSFSARELDGATEIAALEAVNLRTRVKDLLPGLGEGVQLLTLGTRAVFMLPPELSFGTGPWPAGVKRGVPILFFVQLVEIVPDGG